MQYELTEEQVNEIQEEYCDSKNAILAIANELNKISFIEDEEDFLYLVKEISSRYQSAKTHVLLHLGLNQRYDEETNSVIDSKTNKSRNLGLLINDFMTLEEMIELGLKRKYPDYFEEDDLGSYQKIKSI